MTVIEKLRAYADAKGIKYNRMEKDLGKANSYLTQVKNASSDVLVKACAIYPDLSAEWLLRDDVEMFAREKSSQKEEMLLERLVIAQKRIIELELENEILKRNA